MSVRVKTLPNQFYSLYHDDEDTQNHGLVAGCQNSIERIHNSTGIILSLMGRCAHLIHTHHRIAGTRPLNPFQSLFFDAREVMIGGIEQFDFLFTRHTGFPRGLRQVFKSHTPGDILQEPGISISVVETRVDPMTGVYQRNDRPFLILRIFIMTRRRAWELSEKVNQPFEPSSP